ncbi:FAD-dependent oxidoreductase [Pseudothermotoga hypogea]|uniref:FAD-dependent oxidoreductase n=1 Tax=Pseudothermotoga hypogea TaxID=57487 RepID=UPI0003F8A88F|nr:FAD-dependent oxidoreductase [Pseudothermotoga hypogea]MBC7121720.1 FAD-dependent oxidoreductase [Pseudothermotoga sp.]
MAKVPRVVVVGGGWGGCAAAAAARKAGAEVVLIERADMLLGTGLVGGIFRNNGRFTAAEEMLEMGADIFAVMDRCAIHTNVEFPGHKHASLYSVYKIEPAVREYLTGLGVQIMTNARVIDVAKEKDKIVCVVVEKHEPVRGDVFVDATGTSAVPANCTKYGNGCAMCILRCHSFGPRVSLTTRVGVEEWIGKKPDGSLGAMSGSCKLCKDSIDPSIVRELEEKGCALVPVPEHVREEEKLLSMKACQQYALPEFIENLVLLDTGPVKLMTPFFPLEQLRKIPGMERARYEDPIAGGKGNSMRYFGFANCTPELQAIGPVDNLFCAGEKAGAMVGHTEAIVTGSLAGHNAVRKAIGEKLLRYPDELAVGDFVNHVIEEMKKEEGRQYKYTFSGSIYFKRMVQKNLYTTNVEEIKKRVHNANLKDIFNTKLV